MSTNVRRLFAGFQPSNYQLRLEPDRDSKQLRGRVVVTGQKVGRPSQRLTLHQRGLQILSAQITRHDKKGDQTFEVERINHHSSYDEVRLHTASLLYAGRYTITLEFTGSIQPTMHGVYTCNFAVDGQKQQLIATQFESIHAREAFPCVDEPEAKATFDLTLVSPVGETAISNMPAKSTAEENGKLVTVFETSPRMSTYLLAFVYGNMHCKAGKTKDGVDVRVWATKAQPLAALDFPLDVAIRAIEFFNDYYGVPYPLAKCDHVALPDFSSGAMENWGLITYREIALLADPSVASHSSREYITTVVGHELSHQWFGDLVTMKWWDNLWLNESFANVMEYVVSDALYPDWHVWNTFVGQEGLSSLRRDSIAGVQPVQMAVHHPDEIDTIFDPSIVYAKGGRLLNMLRTYLGDDAFRRGLTAYFAKHRYGNTSGDDLWAALGEASGKDVAGFMNPWLTRSGFPVVQVDQEGAELQLTQQHFLLDPAKADASRLWPVPLLSSSKELPALLETAETSATLSSPDYVRLNQGAVGHYIVHYTRPEHSAAIAALVDNKQLGVAERLMLLSDSGMLARGNQQSFGETLQLLTHYQGEDSEPVWDMIALTIADSRRFVDLDDSLENSIRAFIRPLIQKQYERLGWQEVGGEAVDDTKLRASILGLGVYARHEAITKEAIAHFERYQQDASSVPTELRSITFAAAIRSQAAGAFEYLLNLLQTTHNADLQQEALLALCLTEDNQQIDQLLARLKDSKRVRQQDLIYWFLGLLRNRQARTQMWQWLRSNWQWIADQFHGDTHYSEFPRYFASCLSTRQLQAEYHAFFADKQDQPALARNIAVGEEEIANRVDWLERDLTAVQGFFADADKA
ncbi:MAG TPA: M1 family metallopeptidase [Candidatus Saccharimonadales bacterium]|nr:M1 family metallopeptidase [Candidatus Saccharimonadales bacterium]